MTSLNKLLHRFLIVFFYYLYHQMSWAYDWVAAIVSLGRWNSWVYNTIPYLNGQKILELGHGPGHLLLKLTESGKQAYGIDLSPQMARIALARLRKSNLPANLSIAKAQEIPVGAGEFDHVVATFPTEYIFAERTVKEFYRVLKPGGSAIIVPTAYITGKGIFDRVASWLFQITGQSPQFNNQTIKPAIQSGFDVTYHYEDLKSSRVLIILAKKTKAINI